MPSRLAVRMFSSPSIRKPCAPKMSRSPMRPAEKYKLDALVSTDGDADRPLVADENGVFLRGDSLGLLTARFLNADAVVTPVTSNTAIELSGLFAKVYRTRVGSPYVIEGMEQAVKDGYRRVVGFEANGGVLLGSSVTTDSGQLDALPTRDAMLPILSVLGMAAKDGVALSKLSGWVAFALYAQWPHRTCLCGTKRSVPAKLA